MRLEQVLANLVGNAVKFTERGGSVTVRAEASGDMVRVAVIDTGVGIPPEHLPHIFDRYWHARRQSRTVGTGLGLAIARGIVEAHGGSSVESALGEGPRSSSPSRPSSLIARRQRRGPSAARRPRHDVGADRSRRPRSFGW